MADTEATTTRTVKVLPEYDVQEKAVIAALKPFADKAEELAKLLPPDGAKVGTPEMNNSTSGKLQAAIATFLTIFKNKTGRPIKAPVVSGKSKPDSDNPAQMLEADRKAMIKAARDFIAAARACDLDVEGMGNAVGLADLLTLPAEEQQAISKQVREIKAKVAKGKTPATEAA